MRKGGLPSVGRGMGGWGGGGHHDKGLALGHVLGVAIAGDDVEETAAQLLHQ